MIRILLAASIGLNVLAALFCLQYRYCGAALDRPAQLTELLNRVMISRALFEVVNLNIPDLLHESPKKLEDLAHLTGTHAPALKRLMRALRANGIFSLNSAGCYQNNEVSAYLCQDHPQTLAPYVLHDDPTRWNALGNLGMSLKTGKPSFDQLYGTDYFKYVKDKPVLSKRFDDAMTVISAQEDALIAESVLFHGTVADIGGGAGQLLSKIKAKAPSVQGILVDLPQVTQYVSAEAPFQVVAGSFFDTIPVRADIFILKRILHDWNDEQAIVLLRNVVAAMDEDSCLYIIDAIVDECENRALITDIDLRLLTIFGGQERERVDFERLCAQVGLRICTTKAISPIIHVLMCEKIKA